MACTAVVPPAYTLAPAGADVGVVFSVDGAEIEAHWSRVDASNLRTRLADDGASVSTVEHVMAALAALGVDNTLVLLDGDEVPAMDGSARDFVSAIDEAGVVALPAPRRALQVVKPVRVSDGAGWAELRPAEAGLHLDVEIVFPCPVGRQRFALHLQLRRRSGANWPALAVSILARCGASVA